MRGWFGGGRGGGPKLEVIKYIHAHEMEPLRDHKSKLKVIKYRGEKIIYMPYLLQGWTTTSLRSAPRVWCLAIWKSTEKKWTQSKIKILRNKMKRFGFKRLAYELGSPCTAATELIAAWTTIKKPMRATNHAAPDLRLMAGDMFLRGWLFVHSLFLPSHSTGINRFFEWLEGWFPIF